MKALRKRHSWPPLRKPRSFYFDESMDQDPFAYFISPAEDRDVFINNHLTAGIKPKRRCRSHSPAHKRLTATLSAAVAASSPTAKLKEWIERMEVRCFHRSPSIPERPLPSPDPPQAPETFQNLSPPLRGRRNIRSSSTNRVRRYSNSHSRRPRVWKEPGKDIWPVEEEGDDVGLGIVV